MKHTPTMVCKDGDEFWKNPTFNLTLYNPIKNGGYFFGFLGVIFATIEVGLGLVGLGVGLRVILWSFLAILPPILP
jgi:hypothetical protein